MTITSNRLRLTSLCTVLTCLISSSGCGPSKPSQTPMEAARVGGNGSLTIGTTTANFQEWNGGVAVVIWTDIETGHTPGNASRGGIHVDNSPFKISISGTNSSADGRLVEWQGETSDGKTGVITINKLRYDLSNGPLFLVSTTGMNPQIRQLKRDLLGLEQGAEGLRSLAKEDPEVKQFIADASKQK